ncbi:MAG: hypothetical protein AB2L14_24935 [Candidatus Xenobiia bacterium LiM19]
MSFLIIFSLLLSAAATAAETPKKEIEWIITMPCLTQLTWKDYDTKMAGTFRCSGDSGQKIKEISEGLKSRGWTVSDLSNASTGIIPSKPQILTATKGAMKLSLAMVGAGATSSILTLSLKTGEHSTPVSGGGSTSVSGGSSTTASGGGSTSVSGGNSTTASGGGSKPVSGGNSTTASGGGSSQSSGDTGSGYREISGTIMENQNGNCFVAAGKELTLTANLKGSLVVKKGATAYILGNVTGDVTNYGNCDISGNVTGNVKNKGGSLNVTGKVSGRTEY